MPGDMHARGQVPDIYGWGHLTGQGALRMKEKDAKAFQKLLVEHCVKLLKHKEE